MPVKEKRRGSELEMKSFRGKNRKTYLVFKTAGGSYHVFMEVQAKEAARECGAVEGHTSTMWTQLWKQS